MNEPNMLKAIEPKSDQLNADDLIGGRTITIKITKVSGLEGEQKIAINYEGDNGKPYKPGKSMCRVLVALWGDKGKDYVGKSMTLYTDPEVMFGGVKVGGIRISHMSGITEPHVIALTNKKGSRKPFTVKPLIGSVEPNAEEWIATIAACPDMDALKAKYSEAAKLFSGNTNFARISAAKDKRKEELTPPVEGANSPNDE